MATEKNLKKLTIHKLKKKTYNALAEKPVDELVMLTDVGGQVAEITEASADYVGEIVQYVGETNDTYTNGYFYKCVETDGAYSWIQANVQAGGGAGGDYLPLSGGTLRGSLGIEVKGPYLNNVDILSIKTSEPNGANAKSWGFVANVGGAGLYYNGFLHPRTDRSGYLGNSTHRWVSVATTKLNNGADLIVPTEGGTLARLEDLEGIGGGASLPDQTDNAGKFLMTDGTKASWGSAITNTANSDNSLCIGGNDTTYGQPFSVWIGLGSGPENAYASNSLAVGGSAKAGATAVALGTWATAKNNGISIGYMADSTYNAIQLGNGTNYDENTFKVANANGNFEMMDANGNVPRERLKNLVEVLPTADNGYTTVKNFGNNYIEATGIYEVGSVEANAEVVDVIPFPEGIQFEEGQMYWANAHATTEDANGNTVVANVISRGSSDITIVYKNLGSTEVENLTICWEVRGVVAAK
jgi:hypothetical protein